MDFCWFWSILGLGLALGFVVVVPGAVPVVRALRRDLWRSNTTAKRSDATGSQDYFRTAACPLTY
jgi:hypothetical protein